MDISKLMHQYASLMGGMSGSKNPSSSSGGGRSSFKTILLTTIFVGLFFLTMYYKAVSKIACRYADKKHYRIRYEETKTTQEVHPYNHCVEAITTNIAKSGGKIDLKEVRETCNHLDESTEKK